MGALPSDLLFLQRGSNGACNANATVTQIVQGGYLDALETLGLLPTGTQGGTPPFANTALLGRDTSVCPQVLKKHDGSANNDAANWVNATFNDIYGSTSTVTSNTVLSDADATDLQAAIDSAAGGTLFLTKDWTLTTGVTLPANTNIEGNGRTITLGATDLTAITVIGAKSKLRDINFIGFGSSTNATTLDRGIGGSGIEDFTAEGCCFTNFKGSPIRVDTFTDTRIDKCDFFANPGENDPATLDCDIYFAAGCTNVKVTDCRHDAHATTPKSVGCFVASFNGSGTEIQTIIIDNCDYDGYRRGGISTTDEDPQATYGSGYVLLSNIDIKNSGQSAIKLKNTSDYALVNVAVDEYEVIDQEAAGSGLHGGIFLNAGGSGNVSNINIKTSSANASSALKFSGLPTFGSYAAPFPRSKFTISNVNTEGSIEFAIDIDQRMYDMSFSNIWASGCAGLLKIVGGTADPANDNVRNVTFDNCHLRRTGATGTVSGVVVSDAQGVKFSNCTLNGVAAFGFALSNIDGLTLDAVECYDAGQGGSVVAGLSLAGCSNVKVLGSTFKNRDGTTQDYGIQWGAGNSNVILSASEFAGNTAVQNNTPPNTVKVEGCIGLQSIEVTLSPAGTGILAVNSYAQHYVVDGATADITDITGGDEGQLISLRRGNADFTLTHDVSKILLNAGAANVTVSNPITNTAGQNSDIHLRKRGNAWIQETSNGIGGGSGGGSVEVLSAGTDTTTLGAELVLALNSVSLIPGGTFADGPIGSYVVTNPYTSDLFIQVRTLCNFQIQAATGPAFSVQGITYIDTGDGNLNAAAAFLKMWGASAMTSTNGQDTETANIIEDGAIQVPAGGSVTVRIQHRLRYIQVTDQTDASLNGGFATGLMQIRNGVRVVGWTADNYTIV